MSNEKFRVMLAATLKKGQEKDLEFPLWASPKIDGVRMYIKDGVGYTRSNKLIPNKHVQNIIKSFGRMLNGLDGELVVGNPYDKDVYNNTSGAVRRESGEPYVTFCVFDNYMVSGWDYKSRLQLLSLPFKGIRFGSEEYPEGFVELVDTKLITSYEELEAYEREVLAQGYEGVILRSPTALYKQGRSTLNEQGMIKLKRFLDAEAEIIGFEELMHNHNQAVTNALGLTERSSHKENLEGGNKLGALICKTPEGVEFKIGTGFNDAQRQEFWKRRDELLGRLVTYKYFSHGIKEAPRHPVFLRLRTSGDI
ncbi:ATP-dependent DNA ligase [Snodgrassella sp. W8158]|uniref:ATP-dependent DNA ligase n=1 Tax=Snodgrassella sp. W8158 TaxID=2751018 RepID=UPI0018DE461F|nr:ATP-dependent DNA ligase [Snodgrassella sp. W8158]